MTKICGARKTVSMFKILLEMVIVYTHVSETSRNINGDRVRQLIHDNADRLWNHMQYDESQRELIYFKSKTMDRTEWGQFEQIVIWSKMYQVNIEIHSYSMNTQTIDGDENNYNNKYIRLLHCNKSKWGDPENRYDLMHQITRQECNTKLYERRTDSQQAYYDNNKKYILYNNTQSQTRLGEETYKEDKSDSNGAPIAEEEKKTQDDIKAGKKTDRENKQGRLFKQEKKEGTRFMTINLSGSLFDYNFMLEHCKDHVLLIQEHWILKDEIHTWESIARIKGWHGVWEPARQTYKNQDG
eukprot:12451597-Heterocapsa_arctica.AAC.1